MGLETGTYINDLVTTNPVGATDQKQFGDDHLRLIKAVLKGTFPGMAGAFARVASKSANYTVVANDNTTAFNCTAALTLAWTAAATLGNGHAVGVFANGADVVIDPSGAELINGAATLTLKNGQFALVYCTGSALIALVGAPGNFRADGSVPMTGAINTSRATVASAATTADIWSAAGNEIDFTGTATVTDFPDAPQAGASRILHCAAACTFTNNANIAVQGGANYTAAAGDIVTIHAITTSTFRAEIEKADGTAVTAPFSLRNKIINGYMRVDQRNSGAAINGVGVGYIDNIDRWQTYTTIAGKFNIQQNAGGVAPPVGLPYYLGVTTASAYTPGAGDYNILSQKIEAANISTWYWGQPAAKRVTLSFWVYSSLVGNHAGFISNSTLTTSYPFAFAISSANTWIYKTVTIPGPTSGNWNITGNGIGAVVGFCLGNGSSHIASAPNVWTGTTLQAPGIQSVIGTAGATFYVTGVQLEEGTVATPFELLPFGTELALCQRYFWQETTANFFMFDNYNTTSASCIIRAQLPVPMRATPTMGLIGSTWTMSNVSGGVPTVAARGATLVEISAPATANARCQIVNAGGTGISASAEL